MTTLASSGMLGLELLLFALLIENFYTFILVRGGDSKGRVD